LSSARLLWFFVTGVTPEIILEEASRLGISMSARLSDFDSMRLRAAVFARLGIEGDFDACSGGNDRAAEMQRRLGSLIPVRAAERPSVVYRARRARTISARPSRGAAFTAAPRSGAGGRR
jgi:hypothetical protein